MVLELAVKAQAMIITYSKRDFKEAETFDIPVLSPREFLMMIGER